MPADKLTEEFVTTREAAKRLGVGLSTVQGWVESGVLQAWKTPGGHRRIPASMVEAIRNKQRAVLDTSVEPRRIKVLVVEDDEMQRELYRYQFGTLKHPLDLYMAENGFQGLLLAGRHAPDLIITDLAMPEMDGFRMLHELEAEGVPWSSIIVATGLSAEEIASRGGLPNGVLVLSKPIQFPALQHLIENKSRSLRSVF